MAEPVALPSRFPALQPRSVNAKLPFGEFCVALSKQVSTSAASALLQDLAKSSEEKALWSLWEAIAGDENPHPGRATATLERAWYTSFTAVAQRVYEAVPTLRRVARVVRWLEMTYEDNSHCVLPTSGHAGVFMLLRQGRHHDAIKAALHCNDFALAAALVAAVPVNCDTNDEAPLFGEFVGCIEERERGRDNRHRLPHLENLQSLTDSMDDGFRCAILAHICGNDSRVMPCWGPQATWQDELWTRLRGLLIQAFTYATVRFTSQNVSTQYICYLERELGVPSGAAWQQALERKAKEVVSSTLHRHPPAGASVEAVQVWSLQLFLLHSDASPSTLSDHANRYYCGAALLALRQRMTVETVGNQITKAVCNVALEYLTAHPLNAESVAIAVSLLAQLRESPETVRGVLWLIQNLKCPEAADNVATYFADACYSLLKGSVAAEVCLLAARDASPSRACRWLSAVGASNQDATRVCEAFLKHVQGAWVEGGSEFLACVPYVIQSGVLNATIDPRSKSALQFWVDAGEIVRLLSKHREALDRATTSSAAPSTNRLFAADDRIETFTSATTAYRQLCARPLEASQRTVCVNIFQLFAAETSVAVKSSNSTAANDYFMRVAALASGLSGDAEKFPALLAKDVLDALRAVRSVYGQRLHDLKFVGSN
jgi:hypothetical protein